MCALRLDNKCKCEVEKSDAIILTANNDEQ